MTDTFRVGDVVQLKSGGPRMTVTSVDNDAAGVPTVWCTWFEGSNEKRGSWPAYAVQAAPDSRAPGNPYRS